LHLDKLYKRITIVYEQFIIVQEQSMKKPVLTAFSLTEDERNIIVAESARRGLSLSATVRAIINEWFANNQTDLIREEELTVSK
jgi:hypothetical protein